MKFRYYPVAVSIPQGISLSKKTGVHLMSAIKQQKSAQPFSFDASKNNADLTQQERRALSLVWCDTESEPVKAKGHDSTTDHCAELGYN